MSEGGENLGEVEPDDAVEFVPSAEEVPGASEILRNARRKIAQRKDLVKELEKTEAEGYDRGDLDEAVEITRKIRDLKARIQKTPEVAKRLIGMKAKKKEEAAENKK